MAKEKTVQRELPAPDDMEGRKAALASALKQAGYSTRYYYGGDTNFSNMRSYLVAAGFQDIVSEKDFPAAQRTGK